MADLVLYNALVYTLDERQPRAEAIAIRGGRILAVGSDSAMRALLRPGGQAIDLSGRAVIPGFTDSHIHFGGYALARRLVNLEGSRSLDEVVARVAERVRAASPGAWVQGTNWNHNEWDVPAFPNKAPLDRVAPANPVALRRKDGHIVWVNSAALARAGITRETLDPPGGRIDRDEHGEPTGLVREKAIELIEKVIPPPDPATRRAAMREVIAEAHRLGLTGIHDVEGDEEFVAFQELKREGELTLRVTMMLPVENLDAAIAVGLQSGFGDQTLHIGGVKIFADGSLGSQTALMLEPYEGNPSNRGIAVTPKEELRELIGKACQAGLATVVHAIGDRAVRDVLDVFAETPRGNLRHRIEHVQVIHPDDLPRLAQLGIIASMQPIHCTSDMDVADRHWGKRAHWAYAFKSLLDAGTVLAFGSDCPVETLDPLVGVHAAVTRQRPLLPSPRQVETREGGRPIDGWYPEERLTVEQAVRAYTVGAAYASAEEAIKGTIAPGKLADLVVLSRDIFAIPPQEIVATQVDYTIFDGRVVYERK